MASATNSILDKVKGAAGAVLHGEPKRVIIVGGVGGGASCATRMRRLTEQAEITIFEKGEAVSFSNCGLPYRVGEIIEDDSRLYAASAEKFATWFGIDTKENTEVVDINRTAKTVTARDANGNESTHAYDALVLSPGAFPIRPPLPGIELPGIFQMKTVPDTRQVRSWVKEHNVKHAVVVGGGYIGLEMVENLVHLGIHTSVLEMLPQVMPQVDAEMITLVHDHLRNNGVELHLGDGVASFEQAAGGGLRIKTESGAEHPADLVMLVIGVRPETGLAKAAGLELGERGGIKVDESMRTSDPNIWAVGDAVEVKDTVTGQPTLVPLAGPANRQGRIAAGAIFGREPSRFRGAQGTAVVGMFGMTVAYTGKSEKTLKSMGMPYEKVYVHGKNHAGYYPGAGRIDLKLLFSPKDGKVLGCQAIGAVEGVEKRVDVVSMAMQMGCTVFDLEETELCYAPQYGMAKDVVNNAGMVGANMLRGEAVARSWEQVDWAAVRDDPSALILDVRESSELQKRGYVEGAVNIPISVLRKRMDELDKGKKIYVYCEVGQRGYYAMRQLKLAGYDVINMSGGYRTFNHFVDAGLLPGEQPAKEI